VVEDSGVQITDVRPAHKFDEPALERYLTEYIDGFTGPITVRQFEGGQSNPTFQIGTSTGNYVLRKKPPGQLLPSAHMVEREYRVMTALGGSDVPVPSTYLLCEDAAVIGTPFFVMASVAGRVFRHPLLPGVTPDDRRAIYAHAIHVLARLHQFDFAAAGLADYGKPGNYFARQITRWSHQYVAAQTDSIPAMDRLMEWLPQNIPPGDETSIVHGDYRIENMIIHPTEPRIVAVVDWELSTLGHPLADLAYHCLSYHLAPEFLSGTQPVFDTSGVPTEADHVAEYCRRTNRGAIPNWNFYIAFSMFRLASILQGVYARGLQGNASSTSALARGAAARKIAEQAWSVSQRN
jgi:aminoglycoside phosphotransferase (APT) family kinase protein